MNWRQQLYKLQRQPLSTSVLLGILRDYQRPYDKIVELVEQGHLQQVRKGLYISTIEGSNPAVEPFLIANHLFGPSYISLDSALFYWGFIPEQVFEVTSVTPKKSKRFQTITQQYSYTHVPSSYYPVGIRMQHLQPQQHVLIASPEKSLLDKIITTSDLQLRSPKQVLGYLIDDLRIDIEQLKTFDVSQMELWLPITPKRTTIEHLIKTLLAL